MPDAPQITESAVESAVAAALAAVSAASDSAALDESLKLVDAVVKVPIYGHAESLNLATAASVCLYESAFAQRV